MGLIKNIVKYIFILLLIALGVVVLMGAVLFLFPNVSIFGYRYISVNEKVQYNLSISEVIPEYYTENLDKVVSIEIDAENVNVTVEPRNVNISENGQLIVKSLIQGNGFSKPENEGATIKEMYNTQKPYLVDLGNDEYKLVIVNKTADGIVNLTHHKLQVLIPNDLASNLKDLTIKTKSGSINIDKDTDDVENETIFNVTGTTTLQSTSGAQNLRYITVNNLNAKSNSGDMLFTTNIGNIKGNAIIENETGSIKFEEEVDILGNAYVKSGISRIKINDIREYFEYVGESAYLEVGKITGEVYIKSSDAVVVIDEISGEGATLVAGLDPQDADNMSGNSAHNAIGNRTFHIKKADVDTLFLETNTGDITIDELISQDNIESKPNGNLLTESGDITIGKLVGDVGAVTNSGNIKINQGTYTEYSDKKDILKNAYIKVKSAKGNIVLKNIVGELHLSVTSGGNAPIDVQMLEVNQNSEIFGGKGNLKLKLPTLLTDNTTHNIYTIAFFKENNNDKTLAKGSISISLSGITEIEDKNDYYYIQKVVYNEETQNNEFFGTAKLDNYPIIHIYSTGGNIKISDIKA
ncbi:MAG: hypothetical protein IJZ29_05585 [Clostridia bacterium]|nr:hypothetical protein [Clostridia bacterium]